MQEWNLHSDICEDIGDRVVISPPLENGNLRQEDLHRRRNVSSSRISRSSSTWCTETAMADLACGIYTGQVDLREELHLGRVLRVVVIAVDLEAINIVFKGRLRMSRYDM